MAYAINSKRIATNTIALYIRLGVTMIISFFTTRLMLEQLGSEDYGLNNLVGSIVSLVGFINGSMGTAVQRYYNVEIGRGNQENLGRVFSTGLYLHLIVTAISVFIAEIFAVFFLHKLNIPQERMFAAQVVFQFSIITLAINISTVPYAALLRAREQFSRVAVFDIIKSVLQLGVVLLLVLLTYDKLISLSFLNLCINLFYTIAIVVMARKFTETHNPPRRYPDLVKQMLSFVSMLLVTVLANLVNTKGRVILVNMFFGLVVNAAYAVATQVDSIVASFVMNFKQSVVPQMMASYGAGDIKNMHRLITTGTKITFLLMIMVTLPVIFESDFLLGIWLKEPPLYASQLVILTLININISSFTYFLYQGVHATGRIVSQQVWMSVTYILGIVLTWLAFTMGYSVFSAIYVNFFISAVQCVVNVFFAHKTFDYSVRQFLSMALRCVVGGSLMTITLLTICYVMKDGWMRLIVCTCASIFITIAISRFVILDKSERLSVINIIKRRKLYSLISNNKHIDNEQVTTSHRHPQSC